MIILGALSEKMPPEGGHSRGVAGVQVNKVNLPLPRGSFYFFLNLLFNFFPFDNLHFDFVGYKGTKVQRYNRQRRFVCSTGWLGLAEPGGLGDNGADDHGCLAGNHFWVVGLYAHRQHVVPRRYHRGEAAHISRHAGLFLTASRNIARPHPSCPCVALHSMLPPPSEVREQAIKQVRTTDPADEEGDAWKVRVERSVLALEQKMKWLSAGWGGGLLGMGGCMCLFGLGFFVSALNSEACDGADALHNREPGYTRNSIVAMATVPVCLALLLALDLATTSSRCDFLMVELNAARIKHGPEHDGRITWAHDLAREAGE